jgi:hypothetical protein
MSIYSSMPKKIPLRQQGWSFILCHLVPVQGLVSDGEEDGTSNRSDGHEQGHASTDGEGMLNERNIFLGFFYFSMPSVDDRLIVIAHTVQFLRT